MLLLAAAGQQSRAGGVLEHPLHTLARPGRALEVLVGTNLLANVLTLYRLLAAVCTSNRRRGCSCWPIGGEDLCVSIEPIWGKAEIGTTYLLRGDGLLAGLTQLLRGLGIVTQILFAANEDDR